MILCNGDALTQSRPHTEAPRSSPPSEYTSRFSEQKDESRGADNRSTLPSALSLGGLSWLRTKIANADPVTAKLQLRGHAGAPIVVLHIRVSAWTACSCGRKFSVIYLYATQQTRRLTSVLIYPCPRSFLSEACLRRLRGVGAQGWCRKKCAAYVRGSRLRMAC